MSIVIKNAKVGYKEEALKTAFGFKGSSLSCLWQTVVRLESENNFAIGLGVQSVLWSDANIFKTLGEEKGNEAMFSLTKYAVEKADGMSFDNPIELAKTLYEMTYDYAKSIYGEDLRKTFVLNALVLKPIAKTLSITIEMAQEARKKEYGNLCRFDS